MRADISLLQNVFALGAQNARTAPGADCLLSLFAAGIPRPALIPCVARDAWTLTELSAESAVVS